MSTCKIRLTKRGVVQTSTNDPDTATIVAPAIRLFARGQRLTDGGYIARFRFREMNGADKSVYLEWALTLAEKKTELKSFLATAGYSWPRDKKLSDAVWAALVDTDPERRFIFVNAPGWYGPGFALPGKYFCADKTAVPVKIDPNSIEHVGLFTTGDGCLGDWQRFVAKPARKSSPLCVSISAALAAPLLRKLNMDSFAINWFGTTSEGKTLALKVAASVAGLFGPGGGLPSWADSEAGFEGQAMGHRDCILPLDETADGEKEMPLKKRARALAFGIARNRPRRLASTHERAHGLKGREYRIIVLSSSERALTDIAIKAGARRLGGEEVRLIDVPASEPGSQGVFDRRIETVDASTLLQTTKTLVDTLAASAIKYQGHAFVAFLSKLTSTNDWEAKARTYKERFEVEVKAPNSTAMYRIRSNFAIIWAAGALAIDYGVLPWKKSRLRKAVEKCFHRALSVLQSHEAVKAVKSNQNAPADLPQTLKERLDHCKLCVITPHAKVSNEEQVSRRQADGFIINGVTYVKQDRLKAWFPEKSDRTVLRQAGIFQMKRPDTSTVEKKIIGIEGKPRYYVIKTSGPDRPSQ
jgi:Domain of unknown function (DUF927)